MDVRMYSYDPVPESIAYEYAFVGKEGSFIYNSSDTKQAGDSFTYGDLEFSLLPETYVLTTEKTRMFDSPKDSDPLVLSNLFVADDAASPATTTDIDFIPAGSMTDFDKVFEIIQTRYESEGSCKGLLVSGSSITDNMGPYSDLDIFVLIDETVEQQIQWRTEKINKVEVEFFANSYEMFRTQIESGKMIREIIFPISTGRVVFDSDNRFAELTDSARCQIAKLSAKIEVDFNAVLKLSRPISYAFRKIGNAYTSGNELRFNSELGFLLYLIPNLALSMSGYNISVNPIDDLEHHLPEVFSDWKDCIIAETGDIKWLSLNTLVGNIFSRFSIGDTPAPVSRYGKSGAV